jgi:hypothetical protein
VGSPESMSLGLEFNDLSIIQNEGEEEGDQIVICLYRCLGKLIGYSNL